MGESSLEAALWYAAHGLHVFPLRSTGNTKLPHQVLGPKGGFLHATTDEAQIRAWWGKYPKAGVGCGLAASGLIAIDVDPRHDGDKALAKLEAEHGPLDAVAVQLTGGGGTHHFFAAPKGLTSAPGKIVHGVDIKYKGYTCFWPTKHPDNGEMYRWKPGFGLVENLPFLPEIPAWCIAGSRRQEVTSGGAPVDDWTDAVLNGPVGLELDEIRRLVMTLPAVEDYPGWTDLGMAIHHETGGSVEGMEIWDEHSALAINYDPAAIEPKWRSFGLDPNRGNVRTFRSIIQEANKLRRKEVVEDLESDRWDAAGDVTNGEFFAEKWQGRMMFCRSAKKWFRWDGRRWSICENGEDMEAAKDAASDMGKLATEALRDAEKRLEASPDDDKLKGIVKACKAAYASAKATYAAIGRVEAMLKAAASLRGMGIPSPAVMDRDPWKILTPEGLLDLRTAEVVPAEPSMMVSKLTGGSYRAGSKCPRFLRFLNRTFGGDAEVIRYFQRACGYTLTGDVSEEALFFMFGLAGSGKSALVNIMSAVMGEYVAVVGSEILRLHKGSNSAVERATVSLVGARLALANETRQGEQWDDQKAKELTSNEAVVGRRLYEENFYFQPTHKLWIRGNTKPIINDDSRGVWRRLHLIGFEHALSEEEQVKGFERLILEERDAIFTWMVEGALEWGRMGLQPPAKVKAAVQAYREESDLFGQWLEADAILSPLGRAPVKDTYARYKAWCEEAYLRPHARPTFSKQLKERGVVTVKSKVHYFLGIQLIDHGRDEQDDYGGL